MGETAIIFLVLSIFILFLIMGVHIGTVLLVSGIIGLVLIDSNTLAGIIQKDTFSSVASYSLTTIPLFILMAQFIVQADIVKYLYNLIFKISFNSPSALGGFTMVLGGFLGAVSGSPTAISATLAQISVPELKKHGYNSFLAGAIAAAAGSLSTIIPPSTGVIIYGAITQTSIGELFMAMTIPGILTLIVLTLTAIVLYKVTIKKGEAITDHQQTETVIETYSKSAYIISITTVVLIMLSIFGGIYAGVFTPTEAGGVGAFISLLAALALRKVNIPFIKESLFSTIKITGMVLYIILGASIFGRFVTLSLLPQKLVDLLGPIMDNPTLVIILLLVVYFFLFMFLEGAAAIVMTASITVPIAAQVGFDAVQFGILIMVVCTAGLLTPPVGLSVYSVAGVMIAPLQRIFAYGMIFAVAMMLVVIPLLLIFPQLITWLPNSM